MENNIDRQIIQLRKDLIAELNQFSSRVENFVNSRIRESSDIHKNIFTDKLYELEKKIKLDINRDIQQKLKDDIDEKLILLSEIDNKIKNIIETEIKPELNIRINTVIKKEIDYHIKHISKQIKNEIKVGIESKLAIEKRNIQKEYEYTLKKEYDDKLTEIERNFQLKFENFVKENKYKEEQFVQRLTLSMIDKCQTICQQQPSNILSFNPYFNTQMPIVNCDSFQMQDKLQTNIPIISKDTITESIVSSGLENKKIKFNIEAKEFVPKK